MGELAYQLGGKDGYAMAAGYDEQSVPPTATAIADLLAKYGPCIVLIDKWVAYLRQLWSRDKQAVGLEPLLAVLADDGLQVGLTTAESQDWQ